MVYVPERDLLVPLLEKATYSAYYDSVDKSYLKDNYRELYNIYVVLKEAHASVEGDLTLSDLQAFFFMKYPDIDKEMYLGLFRTLSDVKLSDGLGVALLKQMKARKQALLLSEAAFKLSNGNGDYESIREYFDSLTGTDASGESEEEAFVTTELSSIISDLFKKPGLRWRLDALNKSLGSLRKGNFGFIFARPESGKTTFLVSEISCMIKQLKDEDGPVVFFNNEQVGEEVMLRFYQGFFGVKLEQLKANPKHYESEFKKQTRNKFLLVDNATVTKEQVERTCKQLNPSVIIFDQIDKIKGFNNDREDLRLGAIYIWARELAKKYCPVIGVCQADGTAEGQKWLTMDHVANAKTAKQAEADWILGIGKAHGEGLQLIRYLNISKNKLLGDDDTLARLRHGRFEVLIEPEIARYRDVLEHY